MLTAAENSWRRLIHAAEKAVAAAFLMR